MGTSSDLGQPFVQDKKGGLGLGKEYVSHYDIHAEGALLPSSNCDNESEKIVLLNLLYFWEN